MQSPPEVKSVRITILLDAVGRIVVRGCIGGADSGKGRLCQRGFAAFPAELRGVSWPIGPTSRLAAGPQKFGDEAVLAARVRREQPEQRSLPPYFRDRVRSADAAYRGAASGTDCLGEGLDRPGRRL